MADMYKDLERSIFMHLTNGLAAYGGAVAGIEVLNIPDDMEFPSQKSVIRFAKVYELPNDDAPRGPGSEILTPVIDPVTHLPTSFNRTDWPEGYRCNYKINCCAEKIDVIRAMETVLHKVFRPKHPVYLYDADTGLLTDSYCDISYRGFLNQDSTDLGIFSRAHILQFEVYDYSTEVTSVPVILSASASIEIGTPADPTPGIDIVITAPPM